MENKTKIVTISDDNQYQEWKKGEEGYIDGYIYSRTAGPLVCVVLGDRVVLMGFHQFKVT